ncbi:probable receptor-like protein kinase At1g11050 [Coffea eugenioides]|uniref:probable receptor-like protein kinase At1g11050 n=1 Tax=Coffea eugenioides TaxID=49369 RepID=UPI000F60C633|nr:probable receptor-like protein kinase At1g11050 [Coffea eugenioides]
MMLHIVIIVSVSINLIVDTNLVSVSGSCPINLSYVLTVPWDSSACQNHRQNTKTNGHETRDGSSSASSICCQTLTSLYGIGLAQNLKQTNHFRLPDLNTSISCLSDFQSKLDSLSLPSHLTSMCFEPVHFVKGTNLCANIHTKQDWLDVVGPSTSLDPACWPDVSDLTFCDACVQAGFKVHSQLLAVDRNSSHARGCFYYTVLYAAGIVNQLGPESLGAVSCIFGLPMSSNRRSDSNSMGKLALVSGAAAAGSTIAVICILVVFYTFWKSRRKRKRYPEDEKALEADHDVDDDDDDDDGSWRNWSPMAGSLWFKIKELEEATDYFSPKNFIGRGQFGIVYKGILRDGTVVAVKKITDPEFEGDAEFLNEVEIIGNLRHRNLVSLRGCCVSKRNQSHRYLVYDYMPNGNLNDHLFSSRERHKRIRRKPLTWPQRKNIILDVAKALAYLHYGVKPSIYHRDIKATNILLDAHMRARVADFGLARQGRDSGSHLTTRVAGTHGYLAPEYALYGQLTDKSDVYSFGIVVLEIMTGKKALDLSSSADSRDIFFIADWVWSLVKVGKMEEVLDPSLLRNAESTSRNPMGVMERFLMVGILCSHLMVALRPNILDALKMLEGDIEVPAVSDRPSYTDRSTLYSVYTSGRHQIKQSVS